MHALHLCFMLLTSAYLPVATKTRIYGRFEDFVKILLAHQNDAQKSLFSNCMNHNKKGCWCIFKKYWIKYLDESRIKKSWNFQCRGKNSNPKIVKSLLGASYISHQPPLYSKNSNASISSFKMQDITGKVGFNKLDLPICILVN